ncbi:hypothetical protein OSCT_0451 [Oscillochloris trichoides DG-6]|uniref:Competence protein ComEA n=1 Tax=Oscillochloris trichoides DG-6 TaxID=765420 RepID=E1IAV0_9CHLR|nr:helix-hairpin-helix domain-containing protein [Oscillochloris trichoides]EFO81706.1 hypothetical protein OSCT_0451 [Oscillochloris trichoides DG-6]
MLQPRKIFWIGLAVGVGFAVWRWQQRQATEQSPATGPAHTPPAHPASAPLRNTTTVTTTSATGDSNNSAARRIQTTIHRGAPPAPKPAESLTSTAPDEVLPVAAAAPAPEAPAAEAEAPAAEAPAAEAEAPAAEAPAAEAEAPAAEAEAPAAEAEAPAAEAEAPAAEAEAPAAEAEAPAAEAEAPAAEAEAPAAEAEAPAAPAELVNINTADLQALIDLPGINESLARRIIAHRDEKGPFTSVDQLIDVSGIGHKNINIFRDLITV